MEVENGNDETIVSQFDRLCFSFGDEDAISILDCTTISTSICYYEIQEYSKNLAYQLYWRLQPDYVLVDCQRIPCAEAVATLACMRIQCPFVPVSCLDQHRPGRLNVVVEYLRQHGKRKAMNDEPHIVALTVCENDLDPILSVFQQADVHQILYLDETGGIREQIQVPSYLPAIESNDDLMVLFTSGTTVGSPKAVVGSHAATLRRIQWFHQQFESSPRVIRKTAMTFVDGITELWCTLLDRNSLLVALPPTLLQKEGLAAMLRAEPTQLLLLPSQLGQLLLLPKCETLQRLIISGEQASRFMVEQVCSRYPNLQLINLYGQTETTGDVLCAVLTDLDPAKAFHGDVVAVGKPIANSIILVNNQQEFFIQGPQLSNGYLDLHGRSGQPKFDSFATGDIGFCHNGIYYVKGRKDDVVKLHGIWTCPMEIETAVSRFYNVHHVMACFVNDEAYILCHDESVCHRFSRDDMHKQGNLPWNLIPKMAIYHPIPVNSNSGAGKVSRKEAKAVVEKYVEEISHSSVSRQDHQPKGVETPDLISILCHVLNLNQNAVDTQKSFVELGGNSAKAITFLFHIRQVFPEAHSWTALDLLNEDSIEELSAKLTQGQDIPKKRLKRENPDYSEQQPKFIPGPPRTTFDNLLSLDLLACVDSKPVVHQGFIYAACQGGVILKFTPNGDVLAYRHLKHGWMIQADLLVVNDQLIVCAYQRTLNDGLVMAISLDLDHEFWRVPLGLPIKTTPQLVSDCLWVTMGSAERTEICRISIESGDLHAELLPLPHPSMSKPAVVNGKLVYGCSSWEGGLMVVDSGNTVQYLMEGEVGPVVGRDLVCSEDGLVLVADGYGGLHTFDIAQRKIATVQLGSLPLTTPVVRDDGTVVVGSNGGTIYAVSQSQILWEVQCGACILGPPLYCKTDGTVVVRTTSGHVIILDSLGTVLSKRRLVRGEVWGDAERGTLARNPTDSKNQVEKRFVVFGARDARIHVLELPPS